jgi:hypothetical protein
VVTDFDPVSRFNVNFLRQLTGESLVVTITQGGRHAQKLRVSRP